MLSNLHSTRALPANYSSNHSPRSAFARSAAVFLDRIVFFSLLALVALVMVPYGTVDRWWQAIFENAVFALTALWIVESLVRRSWETSRILVLGPMILMTAYAFLQSANLPFLIKSVEGPITRHSLSIDVFQTHLTAVKMLALTLATLLLLQHVTTLGRLKWLVHLVIGIGLASALFGIARQLMQSPTATSGFVLPFLFPGLGYGEFLSSNVFAFLVEMAFALVFGLLLFGGIARQHILLYVVVGVIIWTSLVLSNSRGGLIGFVCQTIFVLLVAYPRFFSRRSARNQDGPQKRFGGVPSMLIRGVAILAIVVVLIVSVFWMGGQQLASKIAQGDAANELIDGTTRTEIWRSTWQLIKHNPWTGVGFGTYFLAIPQFQTGSGRLKVEQAHNDYLDLAANGGIVAVLLALSLAGVVIWQARRSLRSSDSFRRAAALAALAGLISVAVHSFVDFGLQITGIAMMALCLMVITIADIPIDRRNVRISRVER